MCDLPVVGTTDYKSASLVKLDIENGRDFVCGKVRVTEYSLHPGKLGDLADLELLTARVELVTASGPELDGQVLGPLAFLVNALAK